MYAPCHAFPSPPTAAHPHGSVQNLEVPYFGVLIIRIVHHRDKSFDIRMKTLLVHHEHMPRRSGVAAGPFYVASMAE